MRQNCPVFPFLPTETGEGETGAPAASIPALRATAAAGVRGKEGGGYGDSIPGPTSGWDGARRRGDEGRRRWAEVVAAAALQGQEGGVRELGGFVEERRRAEDVFIVEEWWWRGGGGEEPRRWRSGGFGGAP